jgi:flagellar biosynthesis protein FliQ
MVGEAHPTITCPRHDSSRTNSPNMDTTDAVDLGRQAVMITLLISSPVLIAGLVVGLIVGLLQALTQVQEQTVAFVPKLVAMVAVLSFSLPWLLDQMLQYIHEVIGNIPDNL